MLPSMRSKARLCHGILLVGGFVAVLNGCAEDVTIPDRTACTNISSEEADTLKKAVQNAVDTSTDLTAYRDFLSVNGEAIVAAEEQPTDRYYQWDADHWESTSSTTGVTSFIFDDGASLVVQEQDGEGTGHLEGAGFSYYIRAAAPDGFPSGDIRLLSLGEWSAGKRASAEYFGSGLYTQRFPGGVWEEKEELDLGDQYLKLTVEFSLPRAEARLVKRTVQSGGGTELSEDKGSDSLEIVYNGTVRCAGSENILKNAFPDVWGLLQLK